MRFVTKRRKKRDGNAKKRTYGCVFTCVACVHVYVCMYGCVRLSPGEPRRFTGCVIRAAHVKSQDNRGIKPRHDHVEMCQRRLPRQQRSPEASVVVVDKNYNTARAPSHSLTRYFRVSTNPLKARSIILVECDKLEILICLSHLSVSRCRIYHANCIYCRANSK